jgi:iron complex outermembrane receptor protein
MAVSLALPARAQSQEIDLGHVFVTASRDAPLPGAAVVDAQSVLFLRSATSDTATLLRNVPGLSFYGAGGVSSLPVIRGLADDRIRIKLDGMDLIASCPNHMNPVLSYLDPSNVGLLTVHAGVTPVSVGGDSIAGTIVAATPPPVFAKPGEGSTTRGEVGAFYRSNGAAFGGSATATYATESFSVTYAGATAQSDNYTAGRDFKSSSATGRVGHTLPLDEVGSTAYKTRNQELGLAFKSGEHLVEARFAYQDIPYQLWPNQRMDMLDNSQHRLNLRYRGQFGWGALEARAWREEVQHFMDFGPDKRYWYGANSGGPGAVNGTPCAPIGATCAAGMPMNTESTNTGLVIAGDVFLTDRDRLRLGGEFQRYRLDDWWPASGGGMWPNTFWNINDGKRDRAAAYAEWEGQPDPQWTMLGGVRYERVVTDTGPVQAYNNSVPPATVLVPAFNARDRERTDGNWDATLLARYTADATRDIVLGVARKLRSPSLYERYAWFSRGMEMLMVNWFGDGNGYVGDMDLAPEIAHTASATLDWHSPGRERELRASVYYTRVTDYIDAVLCPASLGGACATQTPGADKFVYLQFANQSARLYGLELSGVLPLAATDIGDFGLNGVLSYTNGENRSTGNHLYNIMPLDARLTLTHRQGGWDNALELVMAKAKSEVSGARNEVETAGYGLVNLRASYAWTSVRVDVGVENLFDHFYSLPLGGAYLGQGTTMTTTPVGSVPRWGNAVPGTGRSVYAGVTLRF